MCSAILRHSCPTLVQLFATPWTIVHQAPLPMGIQKVGILQWVAMPSSRGSSQPRDQTQVSHMAGRFFTIWATREAQEPWSGLPISSPRIFHTQEWNRNLLHCRQILWQLSYQGSPPCFYLFLIFFTESFSLYLQTSIGSNVSFKLFSLLTPFKARGVPGSSDRRICLQCQIHCFDSWVG